MRHKASRGTWARTRFQAAALVFPIFAAYAQQQASGPEPVSITLSEAVEMALVNNLDIALQREAVVSSSAQVLAAQGQFDPEWTAAHSYGEDTRTLSSEESVAAGGLDSVRSEAQNSRISMGGQLPFSTRYGANLQTRASADTFNDFEDEYVSRADLSLTQPLLQGRGSRATKTNLRVSRRNMEMSQLDFRAQVESILLNVELAYWDLLGAQKTVKTRGKSVEAAQLLVDQVEARLEVDTAAEADRVQAVSGLAQRQVALLDAERTLEVQDRLLKDLLVPDLGKAIAPLIPVESTDLDTHLPPLQDLLDLALADRPDVQKAEIQIANAEDQLFYVRNQQKPQLDLEGTIGVNGLGGSFSSSLKEGVDAENNAWNLGLVFRTPWPRRRNHAAIQIQESALRSQLIQAQKVHRQVLLEVGEIHDRLKSSVERLKASRAAVEFARLSVENEKTRYDVQKTTIYNLLQLENDLQAAELTLFQTTTDHRNNQARMQRICGTLLDRWDIELEDVPGPDAAADGPVAVRKTSQP